MQNSAIADQFSMLAKLMDLHGENEFRAKTYSSAAFAVDKLPQPLADMPIEKISRLKGIGESVAQKISELLLTGELAALQEIISRTPEGVLQMMKVKGLGPKKVRTLWQDLHIDSIAALKDACEKGVIANTKGFGQKTEESILASIQFIQQTAQQWLYAQVENFAYQFVNKAAAAWPQKIFVVAGGFRRQLDVIDNLEFVTTANTEEVTSLIQKLLFETKFTDEEKIMCTTPEGLPIIIHLATKENFGTVLFNNSCSKSFLDDWYQKNRKGIFESEETLFEQARQPYLPPYVREWPDMIGTTINEAELLQPQQVKGLIHAHSKWSDGSNTIEEMCNRLIQEGFEYLVLSDHSKAAYYAGGLTEESIKAQHAEIDSLNEKLRPFRIYKSIECDILSNGELDYDEAVLKTFDLVIVSIHSNLKMTEEKAMQRLMGAIKNPHTNILGHLSGRRLLRRPAYPLDYSSIIEACAAHNVAIEINANPQRLDISWQWMRQALAENILLSVNPDAHTVDEFANIKYGVLVAQKAAVKAAQNLSSFSLQQFEEWRLQQKLKLA